MDSSECRGHDSSRLRRRRWRRVGATTERPDLPNLLVPIDLRDALPTPPSLFALAETRRVARVAGATVYAIVLAERDLSAETIAQLGRAGADKVLLCEGPTLGVPPLEATHGTALLAAVERVSPLLVLFPAGGAGVSLGPSLAARLGAAFAGPADLEVSAVEDALPDGVGRVFVRFWGAGRTAYRRLDPVDIERPVVAILPAGGAARPIGSPAIDHDVITCAPPIAPGVHTLASDADDRAAIPLARVLVVVDPALGGAAVDTLRAAAPAGVAVADRVADAASVAAATPEILIVIGGAPPPIGTPRARVAIVATDAGPVAGGRAVDAVWRVPPGTAPDAIIQQLAAALPGLALESAS